MARKQEPLLIATKTATITNTMVAVAVLVLGAASLAAAAALTNLNSPRGTVVLAGDSTIPCTTTSTPPIVTSTSTPVTATTTLGFDASVGLNIVSAGSYQTLSKIQIPAPGTNGLAVSSTPIELGRWTLKAEGYLGSGSEKPILVQHARFTLVGQDYKIKTNATEFGSLALIDEATQSVLGTSTYNAGYVDFDLTGYTVDPNAPRTITLRGVINGSGVMTPGAIEAFSASMVSSQLTSPTGWKALSSGSGNLVQVYATPKISFGWSGLAPFYLYHNSALLASAGKPGLTSYFAKPSVESLVLPLTLSANGERDIRLGKMMITVDTSGLVSASGTISNFKLYESDAEGKPNNLLGTINACITGGDKPVHGTVKVGTKSCYVNSATLLVDKTSGLNNFIVPANGKRVVLLVADTTSALVGKKGGVVTMKASISGKKGWQQHSTDPKRSEWGNGGLSYYYTPVGGKENTVAYTASDYYPVQGSVFMIK